RSESYFNEAEKLDPRNLHLLTQHAVTYISLRRFPEALQKLEQVLNITPDDVDALGLKAAIAQAEGDLPRAAALLAPLHPNAGNPAAAQESWRQARSELEPFLKEQPENYYLIGDLALVNMGLGDKAAALALSERAMAANPIEKDPSTGPWSLEILARVAAQMGE